MFFFLWPPLVASSHQGSTSPIWGRISLAIFMASSSTSTRFGAQRGHCQPGEQWKKGMIWSRKIHTPPKRNGFPPQKDASPQRNLPLRAQFQVNDVSFRGCNKFTTPLKTNIDTQNDAMFEAGDTFSKAHHFWYQFDRFRGCMFYGVWSILCSMKYGSWSNQ